MGRSSGKSESKHLWSGGCCGWLCLRSALLGAGCGNLGPVGAGVPCDYDSEWELALQSSYLDSDHLLRV